MANIYFLKKLHYWKTGKYLFHLWETFDWPAVLVCVLLTEREQTSSGCRIIALFYQNFSPFALSANCAVTFSIL